jgi:hypothetical protein
VEEMKIRTVFQSSVMRDLILDSALKQKNMIGFLFLKSPADFSRKKAAQEILVS